MICVICTKIKIDTQTLPHHQTCQSFKNSVDLGCYICNRLWAVLTLNERCAVSSSAESTSNLISDATEVSICNKQIRSIQNCVTTSWSQEGSIYGHPGCYLLSLSFDASKAFPQKVVPATYWRASFLLQPLNDLLLCNPRERLAGTTKSAQALSTAKSWVTECVTKHQHCKSFSSERLWYPTRLLDCGSLRSSETSCRLIETNKTSLDEPYMTLSHCWGHTNCLKLTTSNHAQLLDAIPLSLLPQLYQDAVYITRYLGIRYLWIDSLCIIQEGDGLLDWLKEAEVMGQVYSNSYCNISAANAPDSDHTLFCIRNPEAFLPQTIGITVDGCTHRYHVSDYRFWETEVSQALINTRGWVLQERLLSPRVLHFGERQLFWECRQKDAAEVSPGGLSHKSSRCPRLKDLAPHGVIVNDETNSDATAYNYWVQIVRTYTACQLSYPNDKLVALSAIAKVMRDILRDEYVAGMWRRYLGFELLWSVRGDLTRFASRPQKYRCPSWSWAAVDGGINPGLPDVDTASLLIEVVDFKVDYLTNDNTSLVQDGWLHLRGVLKQLKLIRHGPLKTRGYGDWNMLVNGQHISVLTDSAYKEPQPHVKLDAFYDQFEEQNAKETLYCMPARVRPGADGSIYALILEVEDPQRGVYRRIGLARGWGEEMKGKMLACSGEEDQFPCEQFHNGLHMIRII
ncbi:heterokaryon incompatibility protein [Aaosphaeria arxii CBS 175.79]|uniref:Heterokaryon incompatibility protein n=1 Tax=Aaosphaeria arxii CBS 175.79 TaxID=1450172 RepID=A0A6A5XUD2_9PLEO|nr:heterokaryon incompatibility protein [Aaosphaeria arxii CBS 175.79]KAF2016812.1 heterokaryon incompatibility protein [Aaosphaeria arxii CBS 175.79]